MRTCPASNNKVVHTKDGALAQLRSLLKRNPDYPGDVYPCIHCQGYHVGRLKATAHRNKYKGKTK